MNLDFLKLFFEKTEFPTPAREALLEIADRTSDQIDTILSFYEQSYDHEATVPMVDALAQASGISAYARSVLLLYCRKGKDI